MHKNRSLFGGVVAAIACLSPLAAWAAEPAVPTVQPNVPFVAPASDEGEMAVARFKLPPGFKAELFAAEPRLANPVAFHIDERNRFFVVESFRLKDAVLDVRGRMDWLDDDTASRTVAARNAMVQKRRDAAGIAEMLDDTDRLKLIEDRDGDGKADFDSVFATGFNRLEDGIASGVLARGNEVFFSNVPSLWRLRDANNDGVADSREELQYGYGVRYNFIGHDLHGLRFGPDGKLYFSMGDRGLHVEKTPDGRIVSNPDSGAVLRCNPDGSELELVHTGLRNPQELAFDEFGNLFTGDNNSDATDKARWIYIVEGGDSGWRVGYQNQDFPEPRGPWNHEGLWRTQPLFPTFYHLPPVVELDASGPSGLTYDPGAGLPEEFRGRFFLADFRGGPANSSVHALLQKPKGATFEMVEQKPILNNLLCTDVEFGYDGMYVSDWVSGWVGVGKGRLYRLYHEEAIKHPAVAETRKLMAEGMGQRPPAELGKLLAHADQRVRQAAQFELASRSGPEAVALFTTATTQTDNRLTRFHGIWGLGQLARQSPDGLQAVQALLKDADDEVRTAAARTLGDARFAPAFDDLLGALKDKSPRVQFYAALALGKLKRPEAIDKIAQLLRRNADQDPYLRHAGVMALSMIGDFDALAGMKADSSPAVRMGALLALRRLESPQVAAYLDDGDPNLVLEAARAINDVPIEAAMPKLAGLMKREGLSEPVLTRVLNATYRAGTPDSAAALAAFAKREGGKESFRAEALRMLGAWDHVPGRDRITGNWRPLPPREAAIAKAAAAPVLPEILKTAPDSVRVVAAELVTKMGIADPALLAELAGDAKLSAGVRAAALAALATSGDAQLAPAVEKALKESDGRIRAAGVRALGQLPGGAQRLADLVDSGTVRDKQAAVATLAAVPGEEADTLLADLLSRMTGDKNAPPLAPEIHLDVLEAAASRSAPALRETLRQYESQRDSADPLAAYRETLAGGDAKIGERIFRERADVSCLRCHAVNNNGGDAGPDLAGIGLKQDRAYLLEAIVAPGKVIAPGFETVIVRLADGSTHAGQVKTEDDTILQLAELDKPAVRIEKSKIKARRGGMSSMPDNLVATLSKQDLRHLVEYLASLKEEPAGKKKADEDSAHGVKPKK